MERHDCPVLRTRLLRAMIDCHEMWLDTVTLALAAEMAPAQARTELRALRREWRVARSAKGLWNLGDNLVWARELVQVADNRAEAERLRKLGLAERRRQIAAGEYVPPPVPPPVPRTRVMTWDEIKAAGATHTGVPGVYVKKELPDL